MLQKRSKNQASLKYLLIVPVLAGMLTYVGCTDDNEVAQNNTALTLEEQIADLKSTIAAEENITQEELNSLQELEAYYKSKIKVIEVVEGLDEALPPPPPPPAPEAKEIIEVVETQSQNLNNDVPFAVIDEVPVFPGCENLETNEARKKCMSEQVSKYVNRNFNIGLGKKLGLSGVNRIYVRFKIDELGNVVDADSRASHPKLEEEAERVVNLLPKMTPGKQKGKEVGVLYSLPIVFQTQ